MIKHVCIPYCDGQRYMLEEGAHVTDCFIRDDCATSLETALEWHKRVLESQNCEVIRYWPEADHRPMGRMIDPVTLKPESDSVTYTKYPPYLFLVRRKTQ